MTDPKAAEEPLFAGRKTHKTSTMIVKEVGGMNTDSTNVNRKYTHRESNLSGKCNKAIKIDTNSEKHFAAPYPPMLLHQKCKTKIETIQLTSLPQKADSLPRRTAAFLHGRYRISCTAGSMQEKSP